MKYLRTTKVKIKEEFCFIRVMEMKKGNSGKTRCIYIPDKKSMLFYKELAGILENVPVHPAAHGFLRGRSAITNAYQHVGFKFTTTMDLRDFFDSIKDTGYAKSVLNTFVLERCFIEGAARQGLPTSPAISNIVMVPIDTILSTMMRKIGGVYTRYADDMSFSYDDQKNHIHIKNTVNKIIGRHGFEVNHSKTKLLRASCGRRIICGVGVDDISVYPTRKQKRRLRAATFNGKVKHANGLREWIACRIPRNACEVAFVNDPYLDIE